MQTERQAKDNAIVRAVIARQFRSTTLGGDSRGWVAGAPADFLLEQVGRNIQA